MLNNVQKVEIFTSEQILTNPTNPFAFLMFVFECVLCTLHCISVDHWPALINHVNPQHTYSWILGVSIVRWDSIVCSIVRPSIKIGKVIRSQLVPFWCCTKISKHVHVTYNSHIPAINLNRNFGNLLEFRISKGISISITHRISWNK